PITRRGRVPAGLPRGRVRSVRKVSGATAIRTLGCRSRDHQARPNRPNSLAGTTGHVWGPRRVASSVNGSLFAPHAGVISLRVVTPMGSTPTGVTGAYSIETARDDSL